VWTRKGLSVLLAVSLALLAASPSTVAGEDPGLDIGSCTYEEAGPAGPEGNLLRIVSGGLFSSSVALYRDGNQIRVLSFSSPFEYSDGWTEVECAGGTPTVTNIDKIEIAPGEADRYVLIVDVSGQRLANDKGDVIAANAGGPFGPGATHEASGSEIEITEQPSPKDEPLLKFVGGKDGDSVTAGRLKSGGVGLNLNSTADGKHRDVDLEAGPGSSGVKLLGNGGDDRLSGAGDGAGFAGPLRAEDYFLMIGGDGDDVLLGHPGTDAVDAGPGNDLIRAGKGNDGENGGLLLEDGPGRDVVYGGPGNDQIGSTTNYSTGFDRLFGGPGADTFYERDGSRDVLHCGPDREKDVQFDRHDLIYGCDSQQYQRRQSSGI
jgi:hypothetical protein